MEQYLYYAEKKFSYLSYDISRTISQGLTVYGMLKLALLISKSNKCSLRLSNTLINKVNKINSALMLYSGRITNKRLFDIFETSDECAHETALLITAMKKNYVYKYINRAREYLLLRNKPLLNGNEIMRMLNLDSSKAVGSVKTDILRRQFLGLTTTKSEARSWMISNLT